MKFSAQCRLWNHQKENSKKKRKKMSSISRSYSRGKVNNVIYNDRCGYAIIFYDPIYDLDVKIPPLKMADLPYTIPLQRKNLKPAGKPVNTDDFSKTSRPNIPGEYEAAQDFIHRKIIERKMDEVREACFNIRQCYKKAEKFDLKRREVISPRVKAKIRGRTSDEICDILVDDVMQNIDYVYEKNLEENGKTQKKLAIAALRRAAKAPKPVEKIHILESKLESVKEENNVSESIPDCCKCCLNIDRNASKEKLEKNVKKIVELPIVKTVLPSPPRCGLQNYSASKRRHMEIMAQRASDSLLFEMTYGRMLRRLKTKSED